MTAKTTNKLSSEETERLLGIVKTRFAKHPSRHPGIDWEEVQDRLKKKPTKLRSLYEMEESGGEPDVTGYDKKTDEYTFCDCSAESPNGRRSVCYDREGLSAWGGAA